MAILGGMEERGVAWLLAASVLLSGGIADARAPKRFAAGAVQEFSDAEQRTLFAGKTVSRPVRFERGAGGSYVGGVSYQVVKATPAEVIRALADVNALPHALPRTLSAE